MSTDLEWTIEQEALLRQCHIGEEKLRIFIDLLELEGEQIPRTFHGNDFIRKVNLKGQTNSDKPLPVSGLEYLVNNHQLNLTTSKLTVSHQWFEGRPWNLNDFLDPNKSMGSQLNKLTQRLELIYDCEGGIYRLRKLIDRIAPLDHPHHKTSRFTVLLPNQPTSGSINATRNELAWRSHFITVDHNSDAHLITRIIAFFQLLGLYNPDSNKGATLHNFLELICANENVPFIESRDGKIVCPLDNSLIDLLDEYPNTDLPEHPYLSYKLKHPMDFSVIRTDKFRADDPQATDNDLKRTRFALTNLITHTGGIAITFDIENVNKNDQMPLATPSIASPDIWTQAIRALRLRNKPPKKDEFKAEVHNRVAASLDQSIRHPAKATIHSLPDVDEPD
jgi:hypothetical protein